MENVLIALQAISSTLVHAKSVALDVPNVALMEQHVLHALQAII